MAAPGALIKSGGRLRLSIAPLLADGQQLDVTDAMIDAIARELQMKVGGNAVLNRLEAERLLEALFAAVPETRVAGWRLAPAGPGPSRAVSVIDGLEGDQ